MDSIRVVLESVNRRLALVEEMMRLGLSRQTEVFSKIKTRQNVQAMFSGTIVYAIIVHYIWGLSLLFVQHEDAYTTGLSGLIDMFGGTFLSGIILIAAATMSVVGLVKWASKYSILWMLLQQWLVLISAASAWHATAIGEFPNHVVLPSMFIFKDQVHLIILAVLHTGAILEAPIMNLYYKLKNV